MRVGDLIKRYRCTSILSLKALAFGFTDRLARKKRIRAFLVKTMHEHLQLVTTATVRR